MIMIKTNFRNIQNSKDLNQLINYKQKLFKSINFFIQKINFREFEKKCSRKKKANQINWGRSRQGYTKKYVQNWKKKISYCQYQRYIFINKKN